MHNDLHIGHFYNKVYIYILYIIYIKILIWKNKTMKDIICRYKLLRGYKIYNTCGFESFGIKIEHAAMTRYY